MSNRENLSFVGEGECEIVEKSVEERSKGFVVSRAEEREWWICCIFFKGCVDAVYKDAVEVGIRPWKSL